MSAQAARQAAIARRLRHGGASSQAELVAALANEGIAATQATVSRDLDVLGAVRTRRAGRVAYVLPEQLGDSDHARQALARTLADWLISAEAARALVVLRTRPGSAHVVGAALDQAAIDEIAGTIAGDDTLFLALREGAQPAELAARLETLARA